MAHARRRFLFIDLAQYSSGVKVRVKIDAVQYLDYHIVIS